MKKIYEHPEFEAMEIQFHSPLMVSQNEKPDQPETPEHGAPGKLF